MGLAAVIFLCLFLCMADKERGGVRKTMASKRHLEYNVSVPSPPFPVEELLQKLQDLHSAVNTGKDSL